MVVDYKDSQWRPRRGRRLGRYLFIAVAVAVLALGGYVYRGHRLLSGASTLVEEGRVNEARANLERVAQGRLGQGRAWAGLALVAALEGDPIAMRKAIERAGTFKRHANPLPPAPAFQACFARGDYELARELATFMWETERTDEVDFYLGASQLALGDLPSARASLARVTPTSDFGDRASRLKEEIRKREESRERVVIEDRAGRPLANIGVEDGDDLRVLLPSLSRLLLDPELGYYTNLDDTQRIQTHRLTIDQDVQLVADAALGEQEGFLVVMSPKTAEVLAWVEHPGAPRSFTLADQPLVGRFEPGSIIKVSTYLVGADAGLEEELFPFQCKGVMRLGDGPFYDWRSHGLVADLDHALAVSCNLTFARVGLEVGPERLRENLRRFGFDHPRIGPFLLGSIDPPIQTGPRSATSPSGSRNWPGPPCRSRSWLRR